MIMKLIKNIVSFLIFNYFFHFFLDSKQSNSTSHSVNYKINVLNHANQQKPSYKISGQNNNSSRGIFINTSNNYSKK